MASSIDHRRSTQAAEAAVTAPSKAEEVTAYPPSLFPASIVTTVSSSDTLKSIMPFEGQIAGHGEVKHKPDGTILKPMQAPPKGVREVAFYTGVQESDRKDDLAIARWLPHFHGVERHERRNGESVCEEYLVLEDLSGGFRLPNIMDVKIGRRTWGPDATEKKAKAEDAKYAGTKAPLGFSILGIIVHPVADGHGDAAVKHDKTFGKTIRTEDVGNMPRVFYDVTRSGAVRPLMEIVIRRLSSILDVYTRQRTYLTYASSVLFVYDAYTVRRFLRGEDMAADALEAAVNVKLIDFAHVFPSEGKEDENFTDGLRNLIRVFQDFMDKSCGESAL